MYWLWWGREGLANGPDPDDDILRGIVMGALFVGALLALIALVANL